MAAILDWVETWNGARLDWALTWGEGAAFELSAPPAITMIAALGISGDFAIVTGVGLAGAATAGATASVTLEQTGPMRGDAVGRAVGAGTLGVGVLLTGAATARAQAAATLQLLDLLSGDALAGAIGAGVLTAGAPEPAVPIGKNRRRVGRSNVTAATSGRIGGSDAG
jgi:hypothetical protein